DLQIREGDVGQAVAKVPVTLDRPAPVDYVVQYQVSGGTALPGVDFASPKSGIKVANATVRAGQTSTSVSVTVLDDDFPEPDKTVAVDILSAPGLVVGRGHGELTIIDDDRSATTTALRSGVAGSAVLVSDVAAMPTVSIGAPTVWEGDVATRTALVPV